MAVTLPGRDRERLIRTLAASAIRRPPLSRRPALPGRDRKRLCPHSCPRPPICRPTPSDLRFPRATENGLPTLLPRPPFAGPLPRRPALPLRDRKRLIRALAASAIRRPLSPADLRFPDATENGFARTLAPSTNRYTYTDLRFPRATENGLPSLLPRPLIRRPLSPADLRFPRATENGSSAPLPRPPFAGPSLSPTCASLRDRKQLAHTLAASAIRRPSPPPTCASSARYDRERFPRAVSRKRRAAACALPAWLWLSRRAMWGKKCSSFTIR